MHILAKYIKYKDMGSRANKLYAKININFMVMKS